MTHDVHLIVTGEPVAQPRQRHSVRGGIARNYIPKTHPIHAYKQAIRAEASALDPTMGPVRLAVAFFMPRAKSITWKTKPMPAIPHTKTPDADNFAKAVMDALTGLAWGDDAQVCELRVEKWIAAGGDLPRTEIAIDYL